MTELVTAAEMRGIEADAIAAGDVTGLGLMQRAGRGVVDAILRHWPEARSALVLCGPGNNGGDGYVVARLLAELGWQVRVHGMGEAANMPPDARANRERWEEMGVVHPLTEHAVRFGGDGEFGRWPDSDVIVDAIFGTGLTRAPELDLATLLRHLAGAGGDFRHYHPRLIAVDAPSGLDLDSGQMLGDGEAIDGDASVPICTLTVTFEVPKLGHFLADGPACCGRLEVVDLGLGPWRALHRDAHTGNVVEDGSPAVPRARLIDRDPLVAPALPWRIETPRFEKLSGHKYDHGHALIVSGGAGRTGAARLAARAALRVGAGLVTVASPPNALMENAMHLTAIMTRRCAGPEGLSGLLEDRRFNAICLGPGLGVGEETRAMVDVAVDGRRKVVLDADALTSFQERPDGLFDLIHEGQGARAAAKVILTPHGGEFRALFPDLAEAWDPKTRGALARQSKVEVARQAAERSGAIVLLKGPDTVIADPSGEVFINAAAYDRAVPWLATAGAGDVLAGLITGMAARFPELLASATSAAWLHVEAARAFGPGLIAEDLPEMVPRVLADLGV